MVRCLPAHNKESGWNPGQFADYCNKLRFIPALRARPLGATACRFPEKVSEPVGRFESGDLPWYRYASFGESGAVPNRFSVA